MLRPGSHSRRVLFSFIVFFLKKAPKLYGFKEAPEKHKFISVHDCKARTQLPRPRPGPPVGPPLCGRGPGVKAILSRGPCTQGHGSRPPWLCRAHTSPCAVTVPRSAPALVQHCGSALASPLVAEASPCDAHARACPPRENGLWIEGTSWTL